jgi:hypothetical protein
MATETLLTVVTSAAVGALASSVLSLVGQHLERKARREEILLVKSIEMAIDRSRLVKEVASETNRRALLQDTIFLAKDYYTDLKHLIDKEELPPETIRKNRMNASSGINKL